MPYPEPMHAKCPLPAAFGIALALSPKRSAQSLARIEVSLADAAPDVLAEPEIETLRRAIPWGVGCRCFRPWRGVRAGGSFWTTWRRCVWPW